MKRYLFLLVPVVLLGIWSSGQPFGGGGQGPFPSGGVTSNTIAAGFPTSSSVILGGFAYNAGGGAIQFTNNIFSYGTGAGNAWASRADGTTQAGIWYATGTVPVTDHLYSYPAGADVLSVNGTTLAVTFAGSIIGNIAGTTGQWRKETICGSVSTNGILIAATYFVPLFGNTTVLQAANTNMAATPIPRGGYLSNFVVYAANKFLNSASTNVTFEIQTGTIATVFVGTVGTALTNTLVSGVTGITFTNTTTQSATVGGTGNVAVMRITPAVTMGAQPTQLYSWTIEHWYQDN